MPMASSYALPPPPAGSHNHNHSHQQQPYSQHGHSHSYSYSSTSSSPGKDSYSGSHLLPASNGGFVKKAVSNGSLFTHKESSRETSPLTSPDFEVNNPIAFAQNATAVQANGTLNGHVHEPSHKHHHHHHSHHSHDHSHSHSHDHSHSTYLDPMKNRPFRPRGESDLGRPASVYQTAMRGIPASASWFSLPEALTSLLIPLPFMLASAAYGTGSSFDDDGLPPLSPYARLQKEVLESDKHEQRGMEKTGSAFVDACTLASGTLLLVGILAKIQASERMVERRKDKAEPSQSMGSLFSPTSSISKAATSTLAVGLPFYAATHLGGLRTGLLLLVAAASGFNNSDSAIRPSFHDWKQILSSRVGSLSTMGLAILLDFAGITFNAPSTDLLLGYFALVCSIFLLPLPLPALGAPPASNTATVARPPWAQPTASSPMVSSVADVNVTLLAGAALSVLTIISSFILSTSPPISLSAVSFSTLSVASCAAAIMFSQPAALRSQNKTGLGFGCVVIASLAFLFSPSLWPGTILNGGLSGLFFFGVLYDTSSATAHKHHDDHVHEHAHNVQSHSGHSHSAFTKFLIQRCERDSLIYSILSEKDSRRIAYFTCLNFGFMFVQGVYGWASGSLGLLSDTVHMLFDCLGLVVGLGAAVASKWPTTPEWPYGWGKLNTLAGFGNGIFLILVSFEFVWEAVEGMAEGTELRHVEELFVVSVLGFLVNMVGLFAFGHAHAGHDHGHSHGHDHSHSHHSHSHSHESEHSHTRDHSHSNGGLHGHDCGNSHEPKGHSHGHDHRNENMQGIFLHVAADAGGSAAVILSTALHIWRPWYLWDPMATILIAVLIFAAAIPLVTSSGRKLLLVIPDQLEYNIKNTLQELGELRGVVGYAVPRFWLDDREDAGDSHGHHHHGHDHGPSSNGHEKVMGVIHIIANPAADVEDVRQRVDEFVRERNMDLVVHVEREGEGNCWCGGAHAS